MKLQKEDFSRILPWPDEEKLLNKLYNIYSDYYHYNFEQRKGIRITISVTGKILIELRV